MDKIGTQMLKIYKQSAIEKCCLHVFLVNYSAVLGKHWKAEGGPLKAQRDVYMSICSGHR